jgi:hypothetical protein
MMTTSIIFVMFNSSMYSYQILTAPVVLFFFFSFRLGYGIIKESKGSKNWCMLGRSARKGYSQNNMYISFHRFNAASIGEIEF